MNKMLIVLLVFVIAVAAISCGGLVHDHKWVFHNSSSYTVEVHNRALLDKWRDWEDFSLKPGKRKTVWSSRRVEWRHYPDSKVGYAEKTKSGGYGYDFEMYGAVVFGDRGVTGDAKGTETKPTNDETCVAYVRRCVGWYYKNDYDKAIAECTKCIQINPKHASAYYERGRVNYAKGDYDRTIDDSTQAITLYRQVIESGDLSKAREWCLSASYCQRGYAWHEKGDYDKAIADYTKCVQINPKFAWGWYKRASAYAYKGENKKALSELKQAITLDKSLKTIAKKDEAFKALWDYKDFRQLVE